MAQKYKNIYLIISPPRCASTALARVFWHQPTIKYYSHEPYELVYYEGKSINHAFKSINNPINLANEYRGKSEVIGNDLIIKEMSFQVGNNFPELLNKVNTPPVFLIRNPRLNIFSRILKIKEAGKQKVNFPLIETGWEFIEKQINYCDKIKRKYLIVDANDFRNHPVKIFKKLFSKLSLPFDNKMLNWTTAKDIRLDNLDGIQSNFYTKVLESRGILPAVEKVPHIDNFPEENGFRNHVTQALNIYNRLLKNKNRVLISYSNRL